MTFELAPALVSALIGFVGGTFLVDVVRRTPFRQRMAIAKPHCATCGTRLRTRSAIPLVARATGSNSCGTCGSRLWPAFPGVELFTAAVFALVGARVGWAWALAAFLAFAATMVVVVLVDAKHHLIPNRVLYPGLFATLALLTVAAIATGQGDRLITALAGMAGAWLFFAVVWFVNPRGIGFGDVRLAALLGLAAGWVGIGNVILGIFFGLLLGAVGGLVLMVVQRVGRKHPIPFGPYLVAGGFVAIFFGQSFDFFLAG